MLDPALFAAPVVRAALAGRDISQVYRLLVGAGIPQRRIAELTGQSQSEVSEILAGRQVQSYSVLVRIASGLGIPRGRMGLAYAGVDLPPTSPEEEVDEDMKRRALLAAGSVALFNAPVLGELLMLPTRPETPAPLPARVSASDVTALRALTRQLEGVARAWGGCAEMLTPVATRAERLLPIPGAETVQRDLIISVAELHTVAGWAAFDAHQDDTARYHFARAMSLGGDAKDGLTFSKAAYLAGVATAERGHFNDGLKMLQLAQIRLDTVPVEPRTSELSSWLSVDSAAALARMGQPEAARCTLTAARGNWQPPNADDAADMSWVTGLVEMHLGRPEVAQQLVSSSMQHWEGTADRRQAVLGEITLAALHVQAGEPRGVQMAHQAIESVVVLRSVRARQRLCSLAEALETRPRADHAELAGRARQIASAQV